MGDSSDPVATALARLVEEAELVSDGGFHIDGEAARRKLAERQLADPQAWLLLVLEAAEVVGSLRVELIDLHVGVRVRLVGPGANELAPPSSLERLFDWMFDEVESLPPKQRRRGRARQLFAYAINAATASERERLVVLRARGPEAGARLVLSGRAKPKAQAAKQGEPRLDIDCLEPKSPRAWSLVRSESQLVIARAGYGQWPIHVGGRPLPPQPRVGKRRAESAIELEGERIGQAALLYTPCKPRLVLVANGVELETLPLPELTLGFHAVVEDAFASDLSLGRAIHDARLDAILAQVTEVHAVLVAQQRAAQLAESALTPWNGHGALEPVQTAKIKLPAKHSLGQLRLGLGGFALLGLLSGMTQGQWVLVLICVVLIYFGVTQALSDYRHRVLYGELIEYAPSERRDRYRP